MTGKHKYNIIGLLIILLFLASLFAIHRIHENYVVKRLKKDGIYTIAKVADIYKVKRGYDVIYEFYDFDKRKWRMGESLSKYDPIQIGNCYSVIYSKSDPLIRKIDFSKALECDS